MVWESLQNLGIVATGTAGVALAVRHAVQRFSVLAEEGIDRSADVVEEGIEQFFDKEIARHQAEQETHRVVSSGLYEERARRTIELYQRFVQFERDVQAVRTGGTDGPAIDTLLQSATESGNDFGTYYAQNKIYFPPDTCDAVEGVQEAMTDVLEEFRVGLSREGGPGQGPPVESHPANWQRVSGDEVAERKRELENQCRALLGVDLDDDQLADLDS